MPRVARGEVFDPRESPSSTVSIGVSEHATSVAMVP